MRTTFLFLGMGLVIAGILSIQTSPPTCSPCPCMPHRGGPDHCHAKRTRLPQTGWVGGNLSWLHHLTIDRPRRDMGPSRGRHRLSGNAWQSDGCHAQPCPEGRGDRYDDARTVVARTMTRQDVLASNSSAKICVFCGLPVRDLATNRTRARDVFSFWALDAFGISRDMIEFSPFEAAREWIGWAAISTA